MRFTPSAFFLLLVLAGFMLPVPAAMAGPALVNTTWSGVVDGEPLTVSFGAGNAGTVNGEPMQWQLMGSLLFVEQGGEVVTYQVQQQGEKLNVSGGDFAAPVTLTRGTAAAKAATAKTAAATKAPGGGAAVSGGGRELVGKWCKGGSFSANAGGGSSSMTCFELKADGSYTYEHEGSMSAYAPGMWGGTSSQASDAGRWSVSGSKLTAKSNNGQVSSYALEKRNHPKNHRDPMICLDGDCYTSYWQKAPW
ncbi:MAG: hypothetical protein ACOY3X_03045 [Pseudomonadota bacterium]